MRVRASIASLGLAALLAACAGNNSAVTAGVHGASDGSPAGAGNGVVGGMAGHPEDHGHGGGGNGQIQHVIIVIQENRTFDNLFMGFPGANTQNFGFNHYGNVVGLTAVPLYQQYDLSHATKAFTVEYDNGKLDGWDLEPSGAHSFDPNYAFQYTQQSDVQPYWNIAAQYTLADNMFPDNHGPSFPAHQFLIAGQAGYDNNPSTPWGCDNHTFNIAPICYTYQTLADEMDNAGVSWKYYSAGGNNLRALSIWQPYQAIRQIRYGQDWNNGDIVSNTSFFTDVSNGNLPSVAWISPSGENSDHPGAKSGSGDGGPAWVASIVNAVGQSQYWQNSVVFIVWDDWGGWFDHVAPPQVDGWGYGFRVPLIVVSPYANQGYVSHVQHEFGSILKFTEEQFGLPSLGTVDQRSDDLSDCFNFGQHARVFKPIAHGSYVHNDNSPPDND